jgi:short-subunit dehydrogenase
MDKSKGGKGGTVINMGSVAGLGQGIKVTPIYCATKHGVVGFTQAIGVRIDMKMIHVTGKIEGLKPYLNWWVQN